MRAVLWDLDGTLVDSEEFHWLSWRDTMRPEGVELTYAQFLASFGQRNDRIVPVWLGADVDVARMHRIGEDKETEFRRLAETHGLTPLPGAALAVNTGARAATPPQSKTPGTWRPAPAQRGWPPPLRR